MAAAFDLRLANPDPDCPAAYEDCPRFLKDKLRQRAYRPDGMVARMADEVAAGRWSHHDMIANLVLMLFAGQETVVDAFGNALVALDRFPDQRALLENRAVSWSDEAAEFLRYGASVQYAVARIAAEDLELGDLKVAAGEAVMPVLGSANRDEAVFPDGDRLDLTRAPAPILTFGTGLHVCLDQHIARIEIASMLEALFECAPGWRLDSAKAERRASHSFHGMSKLPLVLV